VILLDLPLAIKLRNKVNCLDQERLYLNKSITY